MKLHTFIQENLEEILTEWEAFARTLLPASGGMSVTALRDHAKEILSAIAKNLEENQDASKLEDTAPVQEAAAIHGSLREAHDFTLVQLVAEYRALRTSVLRLWLPSVNEMSKHVIHEMLHFNEGIDEALAESTEAFATEAEHTLERAKEALFQSQKLQTIGKITGGVAHDFNNLLAVIVSGTELLSRQITTSSGVQVLASMQRAASRGTTLTQQLLSFARQQSLQQEKFNLSQLISAFQVVLRKVGDEKICFDFRLEPILRSVLIDATQFESALLNLVSNARDAMQNGGCISITTENVQLTHHQVGQLPAGDFVKVTVIDEGIGMTELVAKQAIDPFFTTKEPGKGTGMGLSQAYGLMHQSKGDLVIETEEGKYTSVSLYLPATEFIPDEETPSLDTNAGNEKALIVDDQPDVLNVAVELFKTMGYEVFGASNGAEALDILRRTPDIGILFTDVKMPGMDGVMLGRKAREIIPNIKVILVSGYTPPELVTGDANLHFLNLKKPFRMSDVIKLLRQAT